MLSRRFSCPHLLRSTKSVNAGLLFPSQAWYANAPFRAISYMHEGENVRAAPTSCIAGYS